jgi:hypothetical protein
MVGWMALDGQWVLNMLHAVEIMLVAAAREGASLLRVLL